MKKMKIEFTETLKYQREMVIEVPDGLTDSDVERMLDAVERKSESADDIPHYFERECEIKTIEHPDTDLDSPSSQEVEMLSYDYLK